MPVAGSATPEAVLAHELKVRAIFGLTVSADEVKKIDSSSDSSSTELGIPLSPSETAEMVRQDGLGKYVDILNKAGKSISHFGQARVDSAANIEIDMLADSDKQAATLAQSLRALVPSEDSLVFKAIKYDPADIAAVVERLNSNVSGSLSDFHINGLDEPQGTQDVIISIPLDAPAGSEDALKEHFPEPFVSVKRASGAADFQSRDFSSGPIYGGEYISSSSTNRCTAGYSYGRGGPNGNTRYYTATAGHCTLPNTVWKQGGTFSGNVIGTSTGSNGTRSPSVKNTSQNCDCTVIGPIPDSAATPQVLITNNAKFTYTSLPTNTQNSDGYAPNKKVCLSGANFGQTSPTNGITCGKINQVNGMLLYNEDGENVTLVHLIKTTIPDSQDGDSGGPVGSDGQFMGLHSATQNGFEYFSRSVYLSAATGVTPTF